MNGTGKPAVHPAGRPAKLPGGFVRHRTVLARQGERDRAVVRPSRVAAIQTFYSLGRGSRFATAIQAPHQTDTLLLLTNPLSS